MKDPKILHLVLKCKWWDMIASGEKKEEYRDITSLYCARLLIKGDWYYLKQTYIRYDEDDIMRIVKMYAGKSQLRWQHYDAVCLHRGYTNVTMLYEFKGTSIGYGNPAWGAPTDKEVFVIKLGKRI